MLPRDHHHLVINVNIVVDEKVDKLFHKDLLLSEGSRKGGSAGGIPSLRIGRVCRLIEGLSFPKLNAECAHEFGCSVYSAASPINYRSHIFCVTGERVYDAKRLINLTNIWNSHEHYHSHLTMVVPVEEGKEVILELKI